MKLLAWFLGAVIGGALGAVVADLFGVEGITQTVIVVVMALALAALAEGVVKRRQGE